VSSPTATPTNHSEVPTTEEWNKAPAANIQGARTVGCEAKRVREWVRVLCRDYNYSGGYAFRVRVDKGKTSDTFVFQKKGVASLVFPVVAGTELAATFSWGPNPQYRTFTHALSMSWPKDTPEPAPLGRFVDAPESASGGGDVLALLCSALLGPGVNDPQECRYGSDIIDAVSPECVRPYIFGGVASPELQNDMLNCQIGGPHGFARCFPDEIHVGHAPSNECALKCDPNGPSCPAPKECRNDHERGFACLQKAP
jgi:hypothetical protein